MRGFIANDFTAELLEPHSAMRDISRIAYVESRSLFRATFSGRFAQLETECERQIAGIESDTAEAKLRNSHNKRLRGRQRWFIARHCTLYFSLIPPSLGRVPICPRTCCGPRHCQRVSEPVRRALVFGALWQHHGLHDYFFVQSRDRRGITRASCNVFRSRYRCVGLHIEIL